MQAGDEEAPPPSVGSRRRGLLVRAVGVGGLGLVVLLGCALLLLLLDLPPFVGRGRGGSTLWVVPAKYRQATGPGRAPTPWLRPPSIGRPPGQACGTDYWALVTGGPNATVLPVCTREQLKRDAAAVFRVGDGGPMQFPDCRLKWFDPKEACDLLERHDVVLATAGDSLVRHVTQALLTVTTGDFVRGGHMWWALSPELQAVCRCDAPFDDLATSCRFHSVAFDLSDQRRFCPQWTRRRVVFHEKTAPTLLAPSPGMTASHDLAALIRDPTIARPIVYLNFGVHLNFERDVGRDGYLEPLLALVRGVAAERRNMTATGVGPAAQAQANAEVEAKALHPPHILLATFPYPGRKKDVIKYPKQGRDSVIKWNAFLRTYQAAHARESTLVDYAPISEHGFSGDGTHYLQDTNVIMAQLILNHVAALVEGG